MALSSTTVTQGRQPWDFLDFVVDSNYSFEEFTLTNETGAAIALDGKTDLIGQPVQIVGGTASLLPVADEANADAIIGDADNNIVVASVADTVLVPNVKVVCLVRGPASLIRSKIATLDLQGATFTQATLHTAFAALSPPVIAPVNAVVSQAAAID